MYFLKHGRKTKISKNQEEIQKTWKKIQKPMATLCKNILIIGIQVYNFKTVLLLKCFLIFRVREILFSYLVNS